MSDEEKTTQETSHGCCEAMSCAAMMEKMMSQHESGCNCAQMMSRNRSADASSAKDNWSGSGPERGR